MMQPSGRSSVASGSQRRVKVAEDSALPTGYARTRRGDALGVKSRRDNLAEREVEDVADLFEGSGVNLTASDFTERQPERVSCAHSQVF